MSKEEKMKRLLEMQEHPERYTEEEIRQLMADEESRLLYEQMVRATDAVFAENEEATIGIDIVSSSSLSKSSPHRGAWGYSPSFTLHSSIKKIAAAILGVLMLSGIAYAAWRIANGNDDKTEMINKTTTSISTPEPTRSNEIETDSTKVIQPKMFENVPLKVIVKEIADYYHASVEVKNGKAAALRLYYPWNPQMQLEQVVEELNRFEKVQLSVKENIIIIE